MTLGGESAEIAESAETSAEIAEIAEVERAEASGEVESRQQHATGFQLLG
jgi:hypothetical protein